EIIDSGVYDLCTDLNDVFLAGSVEVIWQLLPVRSGGFETTEGMQFVPYTNTVIPNYPISNQLLNSFASNDKRKTAWLDSNVVNNEVYFFPYKYKVRNSGNPIPSENYSLFRLGEQYLIRAEARVMQNNLPGGMADINVVRQRAGLSDTASPDQSTLLNLIIEERRKELFCEWGHRWFDMKRTNSADEILSIIKAPNWQATDQLLPIPFREIQLNPHLLQNPGY